MCKAAGKGEERVVSSEGDPPAGAMASGGKGASGGKSGKNGVIKQADLVLQWRTVQKMGAGLVNLGNTCFMNAVLQCLTHTPPLAEALLSGSGCVPGVHAHTTRSAMLRNGKLPAADPLALTRAHIERSLRHRVGVISPTAHVRTLRSVSKSFQRGRQEDAHEYLIALLDAMHTMAVGGPGAKPPPAVTAASLIHRIFAGRIRSQVKCSDCGYESNTFDPFLDISLEINRASSVKKALERFTAAEVLDGDNKYKCPRQGRMVRAAKRMTIEDAPAVLVVQLKRFEFSLRSRSKISKRVDFETTLDLAPFMSNRRVSRRYQLFGVLVHHGHSLHAGHYVAFVRGPNGLWHQMDDASVSQVSERVVLGQKAYILFYVLEETAPPGTAAAVAVMKQAATAAAAGEEQPPTPRRSLDLQWRPSAMSAENTAASGAVHSGVSPTEAVAGFSSAGSLLAGMAADAATGTKRKQRDTVEAQPEPADTSRKRRKGGLAATEHAAAGSDGSPAAARQSRSGQQIARALSLARPTSPSLVSPALGRSQRRLQLHLMEHRTRVGSLARAASRDISPARGATPTAARLSPTAVAAKAGTPAAAAPLLTSAPLRPPGSSRLANGHAAAAAASPSAPAPGRGHGRDTAGAPSSSSEESGDSSSDDDGNAAPAGGGGGSVSPPVEAPPWPPLEAPGLPLAAAPTVVSAVEAETHPRRAPAAATVPQQRQHPIGSRRKRAQPEAIEASGKAAAEILAAGGSGGAASRWQDPDIAADVSRADALLQQTSAPAREVDEYDADYDRGRIKKVRRKDGPDGGISAASFQGAWTDRQRQHNRGRSSSGGRSVGRGRGGGGRSRGRSGGRGRGRR